MPMKPTTPEDMASALQIEFKDPISTDEVKKLYRSLPGYQAVVDDTYELLDKHAQTLRIEKSLASEMREGLEKVKDLEPLEKALHQLYLSVYHQRLQATSKCMDGLYQTSRRIREFSNAFPEIADEAQFLLDFMKTFRPGRKGQTDSDSNDNE